MTDQTVPNVAQAPVLDATRLTIDAMEAIEALAANQAAVNRVMRARVAYGPESGFSRTEAIAELPDALGCDLDQLQNDCGTMLTAVEGSKDELAALFAEETGRTITAKDVNAYQKELAAEMQEHASNTMLAETVIQRVKDFCDGTGTVNPDPGPAVDVAPVPRVSRLSSSAVAFAHRASQLLSTVVELERAEKPTKGDGRVLGWKTEPVLTSDDSDLRGLERLEKRLKTAEGWKSLTPELSGQLEAIQLGSAKRLQILTNLTKKARQQIAEDKTIKSLAKLQTDKFVDVLKGITEIELHVKYVMDFFFPDGSRLSQRRRA